MKNTNTQAIVRVALFAAVIAVLSQIAIPMPSGVPVATVAVGSAGPTNAALLAVQILGTADAGLREKFRAHKEELRAKVAAANDRIHQS